MTNSVNILPAVDKIFVMKDGSISESGSYDELVSRKGDFADFLQEFAGESNQNKEERSPSVTSSTEGRSSGKLTRELSRAQSVLEKSAAGDVLIEEEEMEQGSVKLSVIWTYFKSVPLLPLVIVFLDPVPCLRCWSKVLAFPCGQMTNLIT